MNGSPAARPLSQLTVTVYLVANALPTPMIRPPRKVRGRLER